MANRSAPPGASCFTGKSGAYEKSLEVFEIFHMGYPVGKSGLHYRSRPVVPPLLLYHIKAGLSIGNLNKKLNPIFKGSIQT